MTLPAPYPPLVSGGDGLDRYPGDASALAARMAAIYAVPADQVLPVRGLTHGLELAYRLAARDGGSVEAPKAEPYDSLAAIYPAKGEPAVVVIRALGSPEAVAEMAARV
ncbi:MAG: imidazoleglycerol-phosphate dehydratase HisB, partial [Brevundimonas mediterranea]